MKKLRGPYYEAIVTREKMSKINGVSNIIQAADYETNKVGRTANTTFSSYLEKEKVWMKYLSRLQKNIMFLLIC